jgi:hypothetical protein
MSCHILLAGAYATASALSPSIPMGSSQSYGTAGLRCGFSMSSSRLCPCLRQPLKLGVLLEDRIQMGIAS